MQMDEPSASAKSFLALRHHRRRRFSLALADRSFSLAPISNGQPRRSLPFAGISDHHGQQQRTDNNNEFFHGAHPPIRNSQAHGNLTMGSRAGIRVEKKHTKEPFSPHRPISNEVVTFGRGLHVAAAARPREFHRNLFRGDAQGRRVRNRAFPDSPGWFVLILPHAVQPSTAKTARQRRPDGGDPDGTLGWNFRPLPQPGVTMTGLTSPKRSAGAKATQSKKVPRPTQEKPAPQKAATIRVRSRGRSRRGPIRRCCR